MKVYLMQYSTEAIETMTSFGGNSQVMTDNCICKLCKGTLHFQGKGGGESKEVAPLNEPPPQYSNQNLRMSQDVLSRHSSFIFN